MVPLDMSGFQEFSNQMCKLRSLRMLIRLVQQSPQ